MIFVAGNFLPICCI